MLYFYSAVKRVAALDILNLYASGVSRGILSKQFGLSIRHIDSILTGSWRSLDSNMPAYLEKQAIRYRQRLEAGRPLDYSKYWSEN